MIKKMKAKYQKIEDFLEKAIMVRDLAASSKK
jgi:hypothetical protein